VPHTFKQIFPHPAKGPGFTCRSIIFVTLMTLEFCGIISGRLQDACGFLEIKGRQNELIATINVTVGVYG
jgi:hypothetical protein